MIRKKWSLRKGTYYKTSIGDVSKTTVKNNLSLIRKAYSDKIEKLEEEKKNYKFSPLDYKKEIKKALEILGESIIQDYIERDVHGSTEDKDKERLKFKIQDIMYFGMNHPERRLIEHFPFLVKVIEDYYDYITRYGSEDESTLKNPLTSMLRDNINENTDISLIDKKIKELKSERDQLKDISEK